MKINEISNSTLYDYISLNAEIATLYNNYTCKSHSLEKQLLSLNERPQHIIDYKKCEINTSRANCKTNITNRPQYIVDNILYKKCLCNYKHSNFNYLFTLYENYMKGNLPFMGAISDQPNQTIELINIIKNAVAREENIMQKRIQKENQSKQKRAK